MNIDFTEDGAKLFQLFREEQRSHGRKGCLCAECQGDMVSALKKLAEQKTLTDPKNPEPVFVTFRPVPV